jgi:DNA gyrase subunit A
VSEHGYGKRTAIDEYRVFTNRGGKGVKTINVTEKTGHLVGILDVTEKDDLLITCESGITLRTSVGKIREAGRAAQGVTLIRVDEDDAIAAISKIEENDEEISESENGENITPGDENQSVNEQPETDNQ